MKVRVKEIVNCDWSLSVRDTANQNSFKMLCVQLTGSSLFERRWTNWVCKEFPHIFFAQLNFWRDQQGALSIADHRPKWSSCRNGLKLLKTIKMWMAWPNSIVRWNVTARAALHDLTSYSPDSKLTSGPLAVLEEAFNLIMHIEQCSWRIDRLISAGFREGDELNKSFELQNFI